MNAKIPEIGRWYSADELDDIFEIVAIDSDPSSGGNTIEIQYFDGDIETWNTMHIENIAQPEDWTGPFELGAEDDVYNTDSDYELRNDESEYDYYYTRNYYTRN
jgi:hypothetical protein